MEDKCAREIDDNVLKVFIIQAYLGKERKVSSDEISRKLIMSPICGAYDDPSGYVFSVQGTPPHGSLVIYGDPFAPHIFLILGMGKIQRIQSYTEKYNKIITILRYHIGDYLS
jgi:hypothetical protein